jgi:hypothetical protein
VIEAIHANARGSKEFFVAVEKDARMKVCIVWSERLIGS